MITARRALKIGHDALLKVVGEPFFFRGKEIIGIPNTQVSETEILKYNFNDLSKGFIKIQFNADHITTEPRKGEYIKLNGKRYVICEIEYESEPLNTYRIYCSLNQMEE
jgi:hypothetical protein